VANRPVDVCCWSGIDIAFALDIAVLLYRRTRLVQRLQSVNLVADWLPGRKCETCISISSLVCQVSVSWQSYILVVVIIPSSSVCIFCMYLSLRLDIYLDYLLTTLRVHRA
jgi:hypothetical protein